MDKRGIEFGIGTVVAFLILIIVAIVIIVGFRAYVSEMFGWIGEQLGGIKGVDILEKATAGEDLTEGEKESLKGDPNEYMAWLYKMARLAFDVGDYEDALDKFQEYVDICEDTKSKLRKGCIEADLEKSKKNIEWIKIITSAELDFKDINNLPEGSRRQAYENFISKYEKEGVGLSKVMGLVKEAKELVAEMVITECSDKSEESLIICLKAADNLRIGIGNSEKIKEKLYFIRDSGKATDQIKAETIFMLLTERSAEADCASGLNLLRRISDEYGDLSFRYIRYSYPRSEYDNTPYSISFEKIVSEAELVLGWCYLRAGDFGRAYEIALALKEEKNIRSEALYRESVMGFAYDVDCSERRTISSCHSYPKSLIIPYMERTKEVSDFKIMIGDITKYPKISCWWSYSWGDECESCSIINYCGDYKTGWGSSWKTICEKNPCEIGYSPEEKKVIGCKVSGNECVAV